MIASIISFLVLLNSFALFIYLQPVMKELSKKDFQKVLFKATVISFVIYFFFPYSGEFIFDKVLQINFEAFRIFGGVIFFAFAYMFIIQGKKSLISMKENLDDLASEIALPFMAGAGTITLSVLIGKKIPAAQRFCYFSHYHGIEFHHYCCPHVDKGASV
jgi:multiple antibiotic resistance protein